MRASPVQWVLGSLGLLRLLPQRLLPCSRASLLRPAIGESTISAAKIQIAKALPSIVSLLQHLSDASLTRDKKFQFLCQCRFIGSRDQLGERCDFAWNKAPAFRAIGIQ